MKSVGEVMSIGRNFQDAMQKAIRMASEGRMLGFQPPPPSQKLAAFNTSADIDRELREPSDR